MSSRNNGEKKFIVIMKSSFQLHFCEGPAMTLLMNSEEESNFMDFNCVKLIYNLSSVKDMGTTTTTSTQGPSDPCLINYDE